jgi:hypothetical protein
VDGSITDEQAHLWLEQIAGGEKVRDSRNGEVSITGSWVSLHFDNPALGGDDRAEVQGGGYNRVEANWTQPSNRAIWSVEDCRYHGLSQTKVVYFGVFTKKRGGRLMAYAELPKPRNIPNGGGYIIHKGSLAISFG